MRRNPALLSSAAIAIVAAASLVGCTTDAAAACTPLVKGGDAASLVSASGPVGAVPTVDFPRSTAVDDPQRTVLVPGEGKVAQQGMTVDFDAIVIDAATGREVLSTTFDGSQGVRYIAGMSAGEDRTSSLSDALVCAQPGQRLALVSTVADTGLDFASVGVQPDAPVVFVVDVQSVYLGKADGLNQLPLDGMPSVVTAVDGTVGISVPKSAPPAETRISTIKAGGGAEVADGDVAILQIASWIWPAEGEEPSSIQTTWSSTPLSVPVVNDATGRTGVTPGFHRAIEGAKVGSQILAVVTPDESYAPGAWPAGARDGSTIIYVIDVLGVQSSSE